MKNFLIILASIFIATAAVAQTVENDLVGLGMKPEQAEYLASIIPAGAALDNNVYLKSDNQAGSATINLIKTDTSDNTVINSSASDDLILQLEDDASRLITFDAASDTALRATFGDGGTTAAQTLDIVASTADADDDSVLCVGGGGDCPDTTRGASISIKGNEASGAADLDLTAGTASGSILTLDAPASDGFISFREQSIGEVARITGQVFQHSTQVGERFAAYVPTMVAGTPVAGTNDFKNGYNAVPTAAAAAAALLPASPTQGDMIEIVNTGPNEINICPGTGDTINTGSANVCVGLGTTIKAVLIANSASAWFGDIPIAAAIATPGN